MSVAWGRSLLILAALLPSAARLSWASEQGNVEFGFLKTDSDSSAVGAGIRYTPSIGEIYENTRNGFWSITPDIELRNGSEGAFDSIVLKLTGIRCSSRGTVSPDGDQMLDLDYITVIPFSIGVETNRSFTAINALGEIGCVPWFGTTSAGGFFRRVAEQSQVGVFIQGGYQFSSVEADSATGGSSSDQALGEPEGGLLRLKGSVSTEYTFIFFDPDNGISISGSGDVWYSLIESELFARLSAGVKIDLPDEFYIDLKYENGSGAPRFVEGDQVGIGLGFGY